MEPLSKHVSNGTTTDAGHTSLVMTCCAFGNSLTLPLIPFAGSFAYVP